MAAFSLKLAAVSATVLSAALIFNLTSPFITISDLPTVYTSFISWLKPPYLYVVINCIIITIVASSKLHSKFDANESDHDFPTTAAAVHPPEPVKLVLPVEIDQLQPVHEPEPEVLKFPVPEISEPVLFGDELLDEEMIVAKKAYEEIKKKRVDESVISMSAWTPAKMNHVDLAFPVEKPPASARFSHRKPAKTAGEGGKTLGVTKTKRQDTLETTWKAINEGRSMPLTKHLRKSDTWETHDHRRETRNSDQFSTEKMMTKSETFDVNRKTSSNSSQKPPAAPASKLSRSGGSGRLRKEPSLGQEELNRRVEAFIKKVNEDMRLQRQESMNQYMEMINRGAH